jgi:DNA-binding transcriptional ArsR family regulator
MQNAVDPVFKALADPTRRGIFERLTRDGEQTVHALTQAGSVSQPMVSKHLAALKRARLVRCTRRGRETHYSAQPKALSPLFNWMTYYATFWKTNFDRLENVLERMEP